MHLTLNSNIKEPIKWIEIDCAVMTDEIALFKKKKRIHHINSIATNFPCKPYVYEMFVIHHTIICYLLNIPRHFKLIVFWLANFMIDFNATRSLFWSHIKSSFVKPLQYIVVWFIGWVKEQEFVFFFTCLDGVSKLFYFCTVLLLYLLKKNRFDNSITFPLLSKSSAQLHHCKQQQEQ